MSFNVNAARAQRLESLGLKWEFEVDGETFSLPTEIPRRAAQALASLADDDLDGLLALLLGDEQYKRLADHDLSVQDVAAVLNAYGEETGLSVGEG
ncbi:hypothetical protein C9F11_35590 [Streptomyces sp. YIM 121038]|uniref:hypothetical protein n=1 Tax=unclassified Streptomyces TaxID=2593676 RepID=UPI001110D3CE|nr:MULTISPECIES: hypothetical protein [unclassified Streptomyces]QCX80701.1 hypothetical protein C9F11_35590 [Streptomyces sp. YIM 121038]